jgi:hypothetical protein
MRFPIKIASGWAPLFRVFGFSPKKSFIELDDESLSFHFGTAHEQVPLADIVGVERRKWPFFYGLGAKIGPDGGVAYVGSLDGVVQVQFSEPRPMNVWGPFRTGKARCVTVSVEDADAFMSALRAAIEPN